MNAVIDYEEFVAAVLQMRNAQKNFFATRNSWYLSESKKFEKQVDKYIEVLTAKATELPLFT